MEDKVKIIDEIIKRHPAYGVDKGWSWYHGGMEDTGDWYFRKMLDASITDLQDFLNFIITDENKPKYQPTEQEIADSKIIHPFPDNDGAYTEDMKKKYNDFFYEKERKFLLGD